MSLSLGFSRRATCRSMTVRYANASPRTTTQASGPENLRLFRDSPIIPHLSLPLGSPAGLRKWCTNARSLISWNSCPATKHKQMISERVRKLTDRRAIYTMRHVIPSFSVAFNRPNAFKWYFPSHHQEIAGVSEKNTQYCRILAHLHTVISCPLSATGTLPT